MAYVDRHPGKGRAATIITVAALHGAVFYALITGLGIDYVTEKIAIFEAHNYPSDPPPPPPEPEVTPKDQAKPADPELTAPKTPIPLPAPGPTLRVPEEPWLPAIEPTLTPPIEPFVPKPAPEPQPRFAPKGATPGNSPAGWVSTNDYPTRDIRQGNEGTARFLLTISEKGRVSDCRIIQSTGHPGLDAATCQHVTSRARFKPATDGSGAKVPGSYTGTITWVIPE